MKLKYVLTTLGLIILSYSFGYSQKFNQQIIGFTIDGGTKKVDIPFENYNNLIVIPILLNGVLPLKFILDTGVRTTILTERTLSDFLQINYDRKVPLIGVDGNRTIDAYVASNVTLKLPGITGRGHGLLVLEEDYLQLKNYLGIEVHGILGYELFSRFVVKINYDKMIITLYEPTSYKPKRKVTTVPISITDTKPYVNLKVTPIDGKSTPAKMMMDTGASHSILLDIESHENLSFPENKIETTLGRGLSGNIEGYIGRVKNISIDAYQFNDVIASFPDPENLSGVFKASNRQGTIGGGLLSKFVVTIDYFNENIYLKKSRDFKKKFEYNMSGLEVKAVGPGLKNFVINSVRPGSPAERVALMKGDTILSLNGHSYQSLKLNDINSFFRSRDDRKIKLIIKRNGIKQKKYFRLEKIL